MVGGKALAFDHSYAHFTNLSFIASVGAEFLA
jgi:hypothetical protein